MRKTPKGFYLIVALFPVIIIFGITVAGLAFNKIMGEQSVAPPVVYCQKNGNIYLKVLGSDIITPGPQKILALLKNTETIVRPEIEKLMGKVRD